MLGARAVSRLNAWLGTQGGEPLAQLRSVSGGSINQAFLFVSGNKKYFVKENSAPKFPGMFAAEAKGLALLVGHTQLVVPQALFCEQIGDRQLLVLNYLEKSPEITAFFYDLGTGLAGLHRNSEKQFGLDHNNYIGSLSQDNSFCSSWNEFFVCRRIEPLLKKAIDLRRLPAACRRNFDGFFNRLEHIFPQERPALLHGDLWSGNRMNTTRGPAIFDPAVYYGHREADIAMTRLFGGFTDDFYAGYQQAFPLEKGWEQRVGFFNLYPLLVHTVLFGGGYASDVLQTIRKF